MSKHEPQQWQESSAPAAEQVHETSMPVPAAPPVVRNGTNGAATTVDVPAMNNFASALEQLEGPLREAISQLRTVDVHPGAFYHANQIRSKVNGTGDTGLKASYLASLDSVLEGVMDIRNGIRTLSQKYQSTEDQNKVTAEDVQQQMKEAQGDFGHVGQSSAGA
ncbi:hypothetical protein ACWEOG_02250 [Amycolatopsis japonica]